MGLILKKKKSGILDSNYFPLSSWPDQDQQNHVLHYPDVPFGHDLIFTLDFVFIWKRLNVNIPAFRDFSCQILIFSLWFCLHHRKHYVLLTTFTRVQNTAHNAKRHHTSWLNCGNAFHHLHSSLECDYLFLLVINIHVTMNFPTLLHANVQLTFDLLGASTCLYWHHWMVTVNNAAVVFMKTSLG